MAYQEHLDILTTDQPEQWNAALEEVGHYDFHHLASYHKLAEMRGEGEARLLVYRDRDCSVIFPMLLRSIDAPLAHGYRDATSVHGYPGPLASTQDISDETRLCFLESLQEYLKSNNVVSAFTRLHPLFEQTTLLKGFGEIMPIGVTVSVDLTRPPSDQVAHYRKSTVYEIERLKRMGFKCTQAGPERLNDFIRIYTDTMHNLNADSFYLYDRSYFDYLINDMRDVIHLFLCMDGENVACVGLFAVCRGIIQYHLAGTASEYRKLAPMKLLLDTVRTWGNEIGAKDLHLGGGVGAQRDSLYKFKIGFGSIEHNYTTWRAIVNQEMYNELCHDANLLDKSDLDISYFPLYRNPAIALMNKA